MNADRLNEIRRNAEIYDTDGGPMTGIPPEHVFDLLAALDAAEQRLKTAENALEQIDEMSIGGGGGLLTAVNVTACAALTAIRPNPKP